MGRRYRCSMADDGEGRSTAADASGGPGTTEEMDPGAGVGISVLVFNLSVLVFVIAACYVIYARWWRRAGADSGRSDEASQLPKMRRRDFTLQQLRDYDGVQNPRILMAVNTKVFDVTSGKKFYGRGKRDLRACICTHNRLKDAQVCFMCLLLSGTHTGERL